MNSEQPSTTVASPAASRREPHVTSEGNGLISSIILATVLFVLFAGGFYVMSLYTVAWYLFVVGLGMSIVSLFITFSVIPKYLT
ncbi:hypothetical protein [Brachybacterium hainanense]|uniref:Uncharacterized protein n=1 Tax=Brachybacterium hainanense TaxID=1541174 RepID=A0ABV6RCL6_9MICO